MSIITLTWNSEKDINDFLEYSLEALNHGDLEYEIIIIDNGSTDNTLEVIKQHMAKSEKIILLPLWKNFGTTVTRNLGLRISTGRYIFIMDSDTKPERQFFHQMLETYIRLEKKLPNLGILHPMLVYPDGTFQESARKFPSFRSKVFRFLELEGLRKKVESIDAVLKKEISPVYYAISACWLLRRDIFENVGLLDEKIFYAPEDAEFCARLWKSGYLVLYYPKISLIHSAKRLTKKNPISKLSFSHLEGLLYFWMKYDLRELETEVERAIAGFKEFISEDEII